MRVILKLHLIVSQCITRLEIVELFWVRTNNSNSTRLKNCVSKLKYLESKFRAFWAFRVEFDSGGLRVGWDVWLFQLKLEMFMYLSNFRGLFWLKLKILMYFIQFSSFDCIIDSTRKSSKIIKIFLSYALNSNSKNVSISSLNPKLELNLTQNFEF